MFWMQRPIYEKDHGHPEVHLVRGFDANNNPVINLDKRSELVIDYSKGYYHTEVMDSTLRIYRLNPADSTWVLWKDSWVDTQTLKVHGLLERLGDVYTIMGAADSE